MGLAFVDDDPNRMSCGCQQHWVPNIWHFKKSLQMVFDQGEFSQQTIPFSPSSWLQAFGAGYELSFYWKFLLAWNEKNKTHEPSVLNCLMLMWPWYKVKWYDIDKLAMLTFVTWPAVRKTGLTLIITQTHFFMWVNDTNNTTNNRGDLYSVVCHWEGSAHRVWQDHVQLTNVHIKHQKWYISRIQSLHTTYTHARTHACTHAYMYGCMRADN